MWNQKFDNKSKDLIETCKNCYSNIEEINNKINDEEKFNNYSSRLANLEEKNNDKTKNKNNEIKYTDKTRNCLYEAQKVMQMMKDENNRIIKENINYIMKNSKKYLFKDSDLPVIHSKQITGNKPSPNAANIKYINDTMRSQFNKAFTNFHPNIHLENLKYLLEKEDNNEIKR
jgi:oligoendopeptidase F